MVTTIHSGAPAHTTQQSRSWIATTILTSPQGAGTRPTKIGSLIQPPRGAFSLLAQHSRYARNSLTRRPIGTHASASIRRRRHRHRLFLRCPPLRRPSRLLHRFLHHFLPPSLRLRRRRRRRRRFRPHHPSQPGQTQATRTVGSRVVSHHLLHVRALGFLSSAKRPATQRQQHLIRTSTLLRLSRSLTTMCSLDASEATAFTTTSQG